MTIVWGIVAIGVLVFLTQVGSGLETYLSTKNPPRKEEDEDNKR